VDDGIALVMLAGEARKVKAAVHAVAGKAVGCGRGFSVYVEENRAN